MPLTKRIIAKLDIKGRNLVKGVNLEGLRVLGKPETFAEYYYQSGADELIYQDVVASLYGKNSLKEIISKTAKNIFIPLTVGGGIRTLNDIRKILNCGADKISINTAAIKKPNFIKLASTNFGSSTIVVSIEAGKIGDDFYAFTDNGRNNSNIKVKDWVKVVEDMGAGEILLTNIDTEGTGKGLDIDFIKDITKNVKIPVIANGGIGSSKHVYDLFTQSLVSGVAISSMFHYYCLNNHMFLKSDYDLGNIEYLNKKLKFTKFDTCNILSLKKKINKIL